MSGAVTYQLELSQYEVLMSVEGASLSMACGLVVVGVCLC